MVSIFFPVVDVVVVAMVRIVGLRSVVALGPAAVAFAVPLFAAISKGSPLRPGLGMPFVFWSKVATWNGFEKSVWNFVCAQGQSFQGQSIHGSRGAQEG